jgi:Xaa-Pro aminopeptidase
MVVSNEPGYYRDGAFGIRCENLVVVGPVPGEHETPVLGFEALTLAPFDRRLVEVSLLTPAERDWLNDYHQRVHEVLAPDLPADVQNWLAAATAPL